MECTSSDDRLTPDIVPIEPAGSLFQGRAPLDRGGSVLTEGGDAYGKRLCLLCRSVADGQKRRTKENQEPVRNQHNQAEQAERVQARAHAFFIPHPNSPDAANRPSWTKDRSRTAIGQPCSVLLPSESISSLDQRRSTGQQVVAILVIPPSCSQEATRLAFTNFLVDLQLYRLVVRDQIRVPGETSIDRASQQVKQNE